MDTPDKAASLASASIADASNKDWLAASARSSRVSARPARRPLEWSASASCYGTASGASAPQCCHAHTYAINGHLYDNISLADSPLIVRSASAKVDLAKFADGRRDEHRDNYHDHSDHQDNHQDNNRNRESTSGCCCGKFRIVLACYVLLGITLAIYSRNALSLAAVGMIASNQANKELLEALESAGAAPAAMPALDGSCPAAAPAHARRPRPPTANRTHLCAGEQRPLEARVGAAIDERVRRGQLVDWTPGEQGLIFAAGSVGNLLIAIPLTRAGEIHGPKWVVFAALAGAAIQAGLLPAVAPMHVGVVIVFQVVFNGLTFGADCVAYTLFAHWLTPTEMAFFVGCLLVCYQMGTIISSSVTARILTHGAPWSWCFYAPAILCALWAAVWAVVGASEPAASSFVSRAERDFLASRSKIALARRGPHAGEPTPTSPYRAPDTPHAGQAVSWLKLARDRNIWAIIAVKFTLRWYFSVYNGLMPTYLSSVAHMSVATIGKMNVLQSVVGLVSGLAMGYLTRSVVLRRPFNVSLAAFRKIFQSIVNFGLAASLCVFIAYDCDQWVTIVALTAGGVCINFYIAAALQLPLDLSPDHCGLIMSITNTMAIGQTLGAPISGLILNAGPSNRALWRVVWAVAIVLNTLSGLLFIVLVDSKPRDYNKCAPKQDNESPHEDSRQLVA